MAGNGPNAIHTHCRLRQLALGPSLARFALCITVLAFIREKMLVETALVFIFGLLWGSFANVVIYRYPKGESVVAASTADAAALSSGNSPMASQSW